MKGGPRRAPFREVKAAGILIRLLWGHVSASTSGNCSGQRIVSDSLQGVVVVFARCGKTESNKNLHF